MVANWLISAALMTASAAVINPTSFVVRLIALAGIAMIACQAFSLSLWHVVPIMATSIISDRICRQN